MAVYSSQQGAPGEDAYELAQSRDGFVGTYAEWRDANKGADGSPDTADQVAAKLGSATDDVSIEAAKAALGIPKHLSVTLKDVNASGYTYRGGDAGGDGYIVRRSKSDQTKSISGPFAIAELATRWANRINEDYV